MAFISVLMFWPEHDRPFQLPHRRCGDHRLSGTEDDRPAAEAGGLYPLRLLCQDLPRPRYRPRLLGGIMGFSADDTRIRDSFAIATDRGLGYSFTPNEVETDIHPNTVDIRMENAAGQVMTVRGESLGGGKVRIVRINGVEVDFTGEYNALIVVQKDKPGVVAHITKILSDRSVNIAFMRLFREEKGHTAYTIVESDERLPEGVDQLLLANPNINDVMVVQP